MCSCHLNFVNKQTQQVENIVSLSFQIIADLVTMPPKSDYWKCFVVQGVLAVCQLSGCPKPNVSLGAPPKPGQKKRISEYKLFHSCSKLKMFSFRYLTPPATSTAVERLFSAAGLIMDAKRNKLSPAFVDKLLFLREAPCWAFANLIGNELYTYVLS